MERKDCNKVGTVQHSLPGRKLCREMLALQAEELREEGLFWGVENLAEVHIAFQRQSF